jgi:hypothetical protein
MKRRSDLGGKTKSDDIEAEVHRSNNTYELSRHPDEERRIANLAKLGVKQEAEEERRFAIFVKFGAGWASGRDALTKFWLNVFGDLYEEYEANKAEHGKPYANLWLASQVIRSAWPLLWVVVRILLRVIIPEEFRKFIP